MSNTTKLILPMIEAAQAQKHVTHNEALLTLDAVVQLSVADRDLADPPSGPADGDSYIVPAAASGAWAGNGGNLATWQDGTWRIRTPRTGWLAWVEDERCLCVFDGAAWLSLVQAVDP